MIHTLEHTNERPPPQLGLGPEQLQAVLEERRVTDFRRKCIAAFVIAVYQLTVGFVVATNVIASLYEGSPQPVTDPWWIFFLGVVCFAVDYGLTRYGIEFMLDVGIDDDGPAWQKLVQNLSGSIFVLMDALVIMMSGGGYVDALLVMLFSLSIALGAADVVMKLSSGFEKLHI